MRDIIFRCFDVSDSVRKPGVRQIRMLARNEPREPEAGELDDIPEGAILIDTDPRSDLRIETYDSAGFERGQFYKITIEPYTPEVL